MTVIAEPTRIPIRWDHTHGRRPVKIGTELQVHRIEHYDGLVQVRLSYPGSCVLRGAPLDDNSALVDAGTVKVVAVSDDGNEAEVVPA